MTAAQVQIDFGKKATESGIKRAVDHADRVHSNWSAEAFNFLKMYLQHKLEFMVEDVREAAKGILPDPPSQRAWGAVILRAAKSGLIVKAGYRKVKNIKAHQTPASVWRRVKA